LTGTHKNLGTLTLSALNVIPVIIAYMMGILK